MKIYEEIFELLFDLPYMQTWPEMTSILNRARSKKLEDWLLPVIACEAITDNHAAAIPAAAAIGCMQLSIILIDDLLDEDPRGEHHHIGKAAAANLAIAFQATGMSALSRSMAPHETRLAALDSLNTMMLTTAMGQHLDICNPDDEDTYWHLVRTKSSPFFSTALYIGAVLAGGAPETADQIKQFGDLYGEMIQIHDDLNDTLETPANPDWTQGRSPLPILFAQIVDHQDRARFLELRRIIPDPDALVEAQAILIRSGAVSYCIDQLLHRYQATQNILSNLSVAYPDKFESLLANIINPVRGLFEELGVEHPDELLQPAY